MTKWILGFAAAAAMIAPARADDAAKKIIEKAITAHGGLENLKKYKASTSSMSGEMSIAGMNITFNGTTATEFPGKMKVTVEASFMGQKLSVLQVVNGDKVKQKASLGAMDITPGGDDAKEELKLLTTLQGMSIIYPLLDEKKFSLKAKPDSEVEGKKASVVEVTILDSSRTVTLSFDKESGLLVKSQRKGRGAGADGAMKDVDEESFVSDYKKVNGVMSPQKLVVHQDGTKFMTCTMSDIENLESLPKSTFSTDD
ncbi:MAG TPA: hypothetical protein VGJ05_21535 [Fimbriiglobus sp.]|jgi:hypothetical protein